MTQIHYSSSGWAKLMCSPFRTSAWLCSQETGFWEVGRQILIFITPQVHTGSPTTIVNDNERCRQQSRSVSPSLNPKVTDVHARRYLVPMRLTNTLLW
jgi:hypothetical protein